MGLHERRAFEECSVSLKQVVFDERLLHLGNCSQLFKQSDALVGALKDPSQNCVVEELLEQRLRVTIRRKLFFIPAIAVRTILRPRKIKPSRGLVRRCLIRKPADAA